MFKNNEEDYNSEGNGTEDTVIGSSIKIEGDLVSNGSINVEGEVVGSLKTDKGLKVGERAKVVANIKAEEAYISGQVEGNITVNSRLELASTARVNGDVQASTLNIAAGAVFNGGCAMTENPKTKAPVEAKNEEPKVEEGTEAKNEEAQY
jgi:cytoskeletal protein CcmA (bactofilin family)